MTVVYLKKGQRVGFVQQPDSAADAAGVMAVAGGRRIPVSDGRYQWVAEPDPGQDSRKVAALVTVVIAATVVVVAMGVYQFINTFPFGPR